ncbi:penicillin-binding protein [Paenibacillus whitsoniae]|uniref:Penicillin-binding protein n=2 Tax=Paenibacillus whitsoniae TaxID=2496558 RepID=A0A3S0BTZ5_9BACL|nr:penicillin-binding protein [Paenibacillus whitsoniae]
MRVARMSPVQKRRIFIALLLLMLVFAGIAGKLFWIQIATAESYSSRDINLVKNSVIQRQRALVLQSGRGQILDRHGKPMTGKMAKALVAFPIHSDYQMSRQDADRLARILQTSSERWLTFLQNLKEPQVWGAGESGAFAQLSDSQAGQIEALGLPNIKVVDMEDRYPAEMTARQLIGFIGQNPERVQELYGTDVAKGKMALTTKIGGSGLEKSFDTWLRGLGETSISYFTDAGKRPLAGLDARLIAPNNAYYPVKLVTTLDMDIEAKIEALMDKLGIKEGAAVVQDAEHGDVIAMASRPNFDQSDVRLSSNNWINYAVKATAPGSIFKTVVAAAALDEKVVSPTETFNCEGALGKYGFTCWLKGGHGPLTLEQGFAESCNIVFANVMKRLTAPQLERYANKLGVLNDVGWTGKTDTMEAFRQFDSEEPGQLFASHTPHDDEGVLMQTAIGQRDVRMTPLAASNLIVTLLHDGKGFEPRVVQEIQYQTGREMEKFPVKKLTSPDGVITAATSRTLLDWMREVVTDGTGQSLKGATWNLAGKSGTAQLQSGKQEKINQWFIGYGPVEAPKYAVSVVVKNTGPADKNQSMPLFKGIMDILAASGTSDSR